MARFHNDRPPELMNILVRQGCDRILSALQTLGTPVYGTLKLSELFTAYEKMFKKELNDFEFYYYFNLKQFVDVLELHLSDVLSFQCPVDQNDPVLIYQFGVEEEKTANVRLQTNVKFLGSPPYNNVQRSPGRGGKTWINSKFNNVTPPRPQQPQPPPLLGSSSPGRGYTVDRSPTVLTMNDRRDHYLPVSPEKDLALPAPNAAVSNHFRDSGQVRPVFNNASPNRPQHQQRRDYSAGTPSSVRRLDFSSNRQQFQSNKNQNQAQTDSFSNMSPSKENRQPNSSPRPTQVPVRRFTKPILDISATIANNNDPQKASDAPVNRPMPASSNMRPITTGYTTPTKLTGSNAVPMGNRFTKRIETPPSKAVPTLPVTDKVAVTLEAESTVSSTSSSIPEPPLQSVNKRLTKKLSTKNDQKEGDSSDSTAPRQADYGASELVTLFPKLSLNDQDGDDELTDAIKPAPVPFLASSEESEPLPSDDGTPTKAIVEPKPLITTKSPNRAQAVLAQFAPRPVPTLNSFAGIRPMVLRNRNRSPSEFSVMSQQVVPFPKKKPVYTASAHRDHAVYTDDDE
uniref:LisH domain-containing protein n=1 Tax=Panagrellus redivivus TaxID=6233 RepID=A0A7E4URH3_PANRE